MPSLSTSGHEWAISLLLLPFLPLFYAFELVQLVFDYLFPLPLRWIWDDGFGDLDKRQRIDTWRDISFPPNFLWGTSTAAHQIEGDCDNNNWWAWEYEKDLTGRSRIHRNQKSKKSCDHWNRVEEDVGLMKDLGCNAYRFSIEWSKLEPKQGQWDAKAFKHYHQEIDALVKAGITPMVTLHHFSHPQWFDDLGAWEKKENIDIFVRFCKRAFEEYSGKVKLWCTINEPEVFSSCSYIVGMFPPGHKTSNGLKNLTLGMTVLYHLLLAHIEVYTTLKKMRNGSSCQIGVVKNIFQFHPKRRWHPVERLVAMYTEHVHNLTYLNFLKTGRFVFKLLPFLGGPNLDFFDSRAPEALDFAGLNYYSHVYINLKFWDSKAVLKINPRVQSVHQPLDLMTDMEYPLYPEGFYLAIKQLQSYVPTKPLYITEHGIADNDESRRKLALQRYLYALSRAIKEGCDVRGFFYWSLMDNFEWAFGYTMRFGLYDVDFGTVENGVNDGTLDRKLRPSAEYYREVIERFKGRGVSKSAQL